MARKVIHDSDLLAEPIFMLTYLYTAGKKNLDDIQIENIYSLIMNEEMMVVIWLWYSVVNVYHTDSQN